MKKVVKKTTDSNVAKKKKVRPWEGDQDDFGNETDPCNVKLSQPPLYKEILLNLFGDEVTTKLDVNVLNEGSNLNSYTPELGKKHANALSTGVEILLTDDGWNTWSLPWRKTLVTKLLRKKINFKTLETYLRRNLAVKD